MSKEQKKQDKKKWNRKILGSIVVLLLASGSLYVYSLYISISNTVNKIHQPLEKDASVKKRVEMPDQMNDPFSILLLGVDERREDRGRSDTMIVLTVNPKMNSVEMVSIPRDTRVKINKIGKVTKINHAFAYGGPELAVETVEEFLDIPIDYFIKANMESFSDIVDAIGGVTVLNDLDFTYKGTHFPKGYVDMNGKDTLKFIRMRYEDERGDFGRQIRQREVIKAIIEKGVNFTSLTKYEPILKAIGDNIKTNLTVSEISRLQQNYKEAGKHYRQYELKGANEKIYDKELEKKIWFFVVPEEEKIKVQNNLKKHLEINSKIDGNSIN